MPSLRGPSVLASVAIEGAISDSGVEDGASVINSFQTIYGCFLSLFRVEDVDVWFDSGR